MSRSIASTIIVSVFALALGCGPSGGDGPDMTTDGGPRGPQRPDEDKDTISDADEGAASRVDTDRDGKPDYQDLDSDGDGLTDAEEAGDSDNLTPPRDADADGTPNFRDLDSDGNGREDKLEGNLDLDVDGTLNAHDLDDDADLIPDLMEIGPDPVLPQDSDGDAIPDYQDSDSDNDLIMDLHEGATDVDADSLPSYLDVDADGDCRADSVEAGDSDLATRPVDTDGDLISDFLDVDMDNDGLLDKLEDKNCNGVLDTGESDTRVVDSDMDGVTDLVEVAAGTNPLDNADSPRRRGDFVFLEPYMKPADPARDTLDFSTAVSKADVFFNMDVTGSMQGAITTARNNIRDNIVPALRGQIPNTGVGLGLFRDFPGGGSGSPGDQPFRLLHRIVTQNTAASRQVLTNAFNDPDMGAAGGGLVEESSWEALYQIAEGPGTGFGGANVPAYNAGSAHPQTIPAGDEANPNTATGKGVGWRVGALPIAIHVTDAPFHQIGRTQAAATTALKNKQIRVIGVWANTISSTAARNTMYALANETGAIVPASAWDGARPSGCGAGQCCTALNGTGQAPTLPGNMCALVFDINGNGDGLNTSVIKGIEVLTKSGTLDISAIAEDDPSDAIHAVNAFIMDLVPNPTAPAPCTNGGPNASVSGKQFLNVSPGYRVCFDVIPRMNESIAPTTSPQLFKATIKVMGDNVTELSKRNVFFLVPPEIPIPQIN